MLLPRYVTCMFTVANTYVTLMFTHTEVIHAFMINEID